MLEIQAENMPFCFQEVTFFFFFTKRVGTVSLLVRVVCLCGLFILYGVPSSRSSDEQHLSLSAQSHLAAVSSCFLPQLCCYCLWLCQLPKTNLREGRLPD